MKYQNVKYVKNIHLYLFLIQTSLFIQNEKIESKYSWKMALRCYKRASLFDGRALGQFRRAGGGWIPLIGLWFWHILFKSRKNSFFSKRVLLTTLYLSKVGPGLIKKILTENLNLAWIVKNKSISNIYRIHVKKFWKVSRD